VRGGEPALRLRLDSPSASPALVVLLSAVFYLSDGELPG
jgi:hypothetical protein